MAKRIKIYSTPTCPYCARAKQYLVSKGVNFEDVDVTSSDEARMEMIEKSGQLGVPVIMVDDQMVVGFDEAKLEELLE